MHTQNVKGAAPESIETCAGNTNMVFALPGEHPDWFWATLVDGVYISAHTGKNLEQLKKEIPGIELINLDEYFNRLEEKKKKGVEEISEETFNDMLEVLPPLDWYGGECAQSFKFSEMYFGNITDIYVKYNGRYFTLRDHVSLKHNQIIQRIKEVIDKESI